MVARIQQAAVLAWLALAVSGCIFLHHGDNGLALLCLVLLTAVPGVLAAEFMLMVCIDPNTSEPRVLSSLLRAWAEESALAAFVFGWNQPFRAEAEPDFLPGNASGAPRHARTGVVLLHGLMCNRGFWNPWIRQLRKRGVPFVAPTLPSIFGSIDESTAILEVAVRRIELATGQPPVIVAHSMGGLVVRAWLREHRASRRVARVVTIGTPHHGTWLARFAGGRNGRQMRPGGEWLSSLYRDEDPVTHALFVCYFSDCDNVVFPRRNAQMEGAQNKQVPGAAHVAMAYRPRVVADVLRLVRRTTATASTTAYGEERH